jgi:hypothetical protein
MEILFGARNLLPPSKEQSHPTNEAEDNLLPFFLPLPSAESVHRKGLLFLA